MTEAPDITPAAKPRHPIRGIARILLIAIAAMLLVRCSGIVESMAYVPSRDAFTTPVGTEDVWFQSADGTKLHGWFMPAAASRNDPTNTPRPAILHVHGNAGNVDSHESFSRFLTRHGFHVLVFDYRGYGRSDDRRINRHALLTDTNAAFAYLRTRDDVDAANIGIFGVSLGGVFALHAAADNPDVRAIATASAFSTWAGVAHDLAPVLGPILMPRGLEPAAAARRLGTRPYLILHGMQDEIINPRHANLLFKAATDAGVATTLWTDPTGDHNAMIQTNPEARDQLITFFTTHLIAPPDPKSPTD